MFVCIIYNMKICIAIIKIHVWDLVLRLRLVPAGTVWLSKVLPPHCHTGIWVSVILQTCDGSWLVVAE